MDAAQQHEWPLFLEEQAAHQWWLWLILVAPVAVAWYGFWRQIIGGEPFGNKPAPDWVWWLMLPAVGIALPYILYAVRLRFEVYPGRIIVGFVTPLFPLLRTNIPVEKVQTAEAVTYRPLWDYGGWGLRRSGKGIAYNMSGNRGVQLVMKQGPNILLGSQQPERLVAAIQQALAEARPR